MVADEAGASASASPSGPFLLPPDLLEAQLSTVELIRAMYPLPGDGDGGAGGGADSTQGMIDRVREWCEEEGKGGIITMTAAAAAAARPRPSLPSSLSFMVTIPLVVEGEEEDEKRKDAQGLSPSPSIAMDVVVPLTTTTTTTTASKSTTNDHDHDHDHDHDVVATDPPPVQYALRQPAWMSRAEVAALREALPRGDVFAAFEYVQEHGARCCRRVSRASSALAAAAASGSQNDSSKNESKRHPGGREGQGGGGGGGGGEGEEEPLLRVWFYFPSLSTREKRRDLVTYAARHGLTGFVLAGKPGVLCLEGTSGRVDRYMREIKNESWGDIPSHQKKVSERFREVIGGGGESGGSGGSGRKFQGMTEITDTLGERRGARKNRGDMAALEAYLREKGVGESFARVVMGQ